MQESWGNLLSIELLAVCVITQVAPEVSGKSPENPCQRPYDLLHCAAGKAQLKYNWSNVCMHYFTRDFLELAADHVRAQGVYHVAKKKIPSKDGPVQVPGLDVHTQKPDQCLLMSTRLGCALQWPALVHAGRLQVTACMRLLKRQSVQHVLS